MSTAVQLVRHRRDGRKYVEKRIEVSGSMAQRGAAELEILERIRRYARTHRNMNILAESYLVNSRERCLILEYCDQGSLTKMIKDYKRQQRNISEDRLWHILLGVANALCFLHYGILDATQSTSRTSGWNTTCHLDIKPCNVFLASSSSRFHRVVLGDFGCAVSQRDKDSGREHRTQQEAGTPDFYPPEGRSGYHSRRYGLETDIWQLGALIQVLGRLLHVPDRARLVSSSPVGSSYSAALNDVVHALTRDDYRKRWTADEVVRYVRFRR